MKPLGVYAFISLLFVGVVGAFLAPVQVFAQGIDRQTESKNVLNTVDTYDYYQGGVNSHFQAASSALDNQQGTSTTQTEATARFKTYLATISGAYTSTFNQEKNKGTRPVDAQLIAITAYNTALTSPANLSPIANYSASAPQRTVISQLSKKISDAAFAAEQIKRGNITAGSADAGVLMGGSQTIVNAGQGNTNTAVKTSADGGCALLGSSPISSCLSAAVNWLIKNIFLEFAGVFLWLTANMLNYAIQIGILNFSQWAPEALYPIWVIVRQIVSLAIVFIGLYLGFMYILGKEDKFEKYIPWVIIFALFVNFSYPLARTAVDISNIVSLNVYSSAVGNDALTATLGSPNTAGSLVMSRLGLSGLILSATKVNDGSAGILKELNSLPASLLAVAFVMYAAYIFFMVTALIVVRTVALVFLTIASPVLFVDSVLPILGDRAQQIRKIFFEQLAVGPIFMIMFALTLKFLQVFSDGPMKNVGTGGDATIKTFFNILMMLIMLHIMLKVTKSVSGTLGQYATDAMGKVGGFGLGVASGGAGLLARGTLGRAALAAKQSKWVTNNQDSFLGRRAYDMSNSLAKSTFDLRNSKVVAGKMDKIGLGMGMGRKVGYEAAREAKIKDGTERGDRTGIYQENIYDKDTGKLLHEKGDKDLSDEAKQARKKYEESGGGSLFTTKYEKNEIRNNVAEADKTRFQTKADKAVSEYGKFDADEEGQKKKKEFFDKQDTETQAKLMKFDAKVEAEKKEKTTEKEAKNNVESAILETNKILKDQQKTTIPQTSSKTGSTFGGGETTTSSGIILPQTMATPSSMRAPETPHTTGNQGEAQRAPEEMRKEKQQSAASLAQKEMGATQPIDITTKRWTPPPKRSPPEAGATATSSTPPTPPQQPQSGTQTPASNETPFTSSPKTSTV